MRISKLTVTSKNGFSKSQHAKRVDLVDWVKNIFFFEIEIPNSPKFTVFRSVICDFEIEILNPKSQRNTVKDFGVWFGIFNSQNSKSKSQITTVCDCDFVFFTQLVDRLLSTSSKNRLLLSTSSKNLLLHGQKFIGRKMRKCRKAVFPWILLEKTLKCMRNKGIYEQNF